MITELAHVPEGDDFYDAFLSPMRSQMLRSVWRIVRSPELVPDTLQDALTAIWRCREKIRLHPNPRALILKITTNVSYDALRKSLRLQQRERPAEEGEGTEPLHEHPGLHLETDRLEKEMRAAVACLPRKQAVAVLMRLVHEQPYPLIARALACSEPTARIHVMRGRARLRRLLWHFGIRFRVAKGDTP